MKDARETVRTALFKLSFDSSINSFGPAADLILTALADAGMVVVDREMVIGLIDSLEAEVEHTYEGVKDHPAMKRRYDRDMAEVIEAKAMIRAAQEKTNG